MRWRAGLPGAVGARLTGLVAVGRLPGGDASTWAAAVGGITHLDLHECKHVTDDVLLRLPASLRTLNVCDCKRLTAAASFAHLTALTALDCCRTKVVSERTDGLPPSLQELDISGVLGLQHGASLAHLRQLRVLRAEGNLDAISLASLPPTIEELHALHCKELTPAATFAHLPVLRLLDVTHSAISDGALAAMPPGLVTLNVCECYNRRCGCWMSVVPALGTRWWPACRLP